MGLLNRTKAAFQAFTNSDNVTNNLYKAVYSFFNGQFYTLTQNKESYVKEGYQKNISAYSAIKLISGKAANARFYAYEWKGDKRVELDKSHPANQLLRKPNEMERQQQFVEESASWLSITGDLYLYRIKFQTGANKGQTARVYALPSQYVQIIGGGQFEPIKGYKLIIGNQEVTFSPEEIIHVKYFNPNWDISGSQLYGQAPLQAALNTVQSSNEGTNAKIKAFLNGGVSGLISSADKDMTMSVEQLDHLNEKIAQKSTGTNNSHRITATNGLVNYQQIGLSPADLEVLKSIEFDEQMIAKCFGIDPILFSLDSASYNNKKEASKSLVNNVITPMLNLLADAYTDIIEDPRIYVGYDISHFEEMQQNLKETVDALDKAWWITPNQKLAQMGREVSTDALMDKVYIPTSYVPLDEVSVPMDANLKNFDYTND
jgi:HK97 family phage portal protein